MASSISIQRHEKTPSLFEKKECLQFLGALLALIGTSAFIGYCVFPSIGTIRATVLMSFSLPLINIVPFIIFPSLFKSAKLEPSFFNQKGNLKKKVTIICMLGIVHLGALFATLAGVQAICNAIYPPLSYIDTLKVFWTAEGILTSLSLLFHSVVLSSKNIIKSRHVAPSVEARAV